MIPINALSLSIVLIGLLVAALLWSSRTRISRISVPRLFEIELEPHSKVKEHSEEP